MAHSCYENKIIMYVLKYAYCAYIKAPTMNTSIYNIEKKSYTLTLHGYFFGYVNWSLLELLLAV